MSKAKAGDAYAGAEVDDLPRRRSIQGAGDQDGFETGPVMTRRRLDGLNAAAKEGVDRHLASPPSSPATGRGQLLPAPFGKESAGRLDLRGRYKKPAGQNADRTLDNAHVLIKYSCRDARIFKQCLGE
jgi:hypothetical protein